MTYYSSPRFMPPLLRYGAGLLMMVGGLRMLFPGAESVANRPEAWSAWVLVALGVAFTFAGVYMFAAGTRAERVLKPVAAPLTVAALLFALNWVAFRADLSGCSASFAIPYLTWGGEVGHCRMAFGWGALTADLIVLGLVLGKLGERWLGGSAARALDRVGHGIIYVAVAPILLLVIVPMAVVGTLRVLVAKARGAKPTNREGG